MSEEKKDTIPNPDQPQGGYRLGFDSHRQEVMIIQVPIKAIAEDMLKNNSMFDSMVRLRGFFDQAKEEAIMTVGKHFNAEKRNGVIIPPGSNGLRVH